MEREETVSTRAVSREGKGPLEGQLEQSLPTPKDPKTIDFPPVITLADPLETRRDEVKNRPTMMTTMTWSDEDLGTRLMMAVMMTRLDETLEILLDEEDLETRPDEDLVETASRDGREGIS